VAGCVWVRSPDHRRSQAAAAPARAAHVRPEHPGAKADRPFTPTSRLSSSLSFFLLSSFIIIIIVIIIIIIIIITITIIIIIIIIIIITPTSRFNNTNEHLASEARIDS
jgi:Flp pilus assembly protein TadB